MAAPDPHTAPESPLWSTTTKLVAALTLVAIIGALLIRFQNIIGPLILSFMLTYLLHPLAAWMVKKLNLSWQLSVNLIFLVLLVVIVAFFTLTSVAVIEQLQNLVRVVQNFVTDLPAMLERLTTEEIIFIIPVFNYRVDVGEIIAQLNIDFLALGEQVLSVVQPILGRAGGLLGTLATSALSGLGWGAFIFIIAYFVLADAGEVPDFLRGLDLPGHMNDLRRIGREMGRIWNAFLRGQFAVFLMIIITSFLLLTVLGVHNALGLAFLAGLAKFVPYIGPLIAGVTTALVAFFQQGGNYLGIEPLTYALIVVVVAVLMDQIFDNIVTPRIFGSTLGVHPAAVLVSAIIAASLIGFVGLLLAAPVLASIQLVVGYTLRKMFDLEPWPEPEQGPANIKIPLQEPLRRLWGGLKTFFAKRKGKKKNDKTE